MKNLLFILLINTLIASTSTAGVLDGQPSKSAKELAVEEIVKTNEKNFIYGPGTVNVGGIASMTLKRGQAFMPPEVAQQIFKAVGEDIKRFKGLVGLVIPGLPGDEAPTDDWGFVALIYNPLGFVRDDDAKNWDQSKLLDLIRGNIEQRNEQLRSRGEPERELLGWVEAPKYDVATHRLLWATSTQTKGMPESALAVYSAVALGREGLMSFSFGTEAKKLAERKGIAMDLLDGIQFNKGKRYEDYAEGTDRIAEIGLAALIGGVAAKKLGLFAAFAVFLAKWGKVIALAVGGAAVFKWRKKKSGVEAKA